MRFLALTGFRISEGQAMMLDWLHSDGGYVAFPDTKGDAQVRAIGPSAARQPRRKGSPIAFRLTLAMGPLQRGRRALSGFVHLSTSIR